MGAVVVAAGAVVATDSQRRNKAIARAVVSAGIKAIRADDLAKEVSRLGTGHSMRYGAEQDSGLGSGNV
jgi:hypothetical protein